MQVITKEQNVETDSYTIEHNRTPQKGKTIITIKPGRKATLIAQVLADKLDITRDVNKPLVLTVTSSTFNDSGKPFAHLAQVVSNIVRSIPDNEILIMPKDSMTMYAMFTYTCTGAVRLPADIGSRNERRKEIKAILKRAQKDIDNLL